MSDHKPGDGSLDDVVIGIAPFRPREGYEVSLHTARRGPVPVQCVLLRPVFRSNRTGEWHGRERGAVTISIQAPYLPEVLVLLDKARRESDAREALANG